MQHGTYVSCDQIAILRTCAHAAQGIICEIDSDLYNDRMWGEGISVICFTACYALALSLEILEIRKGVGGIRWARRALALAGILAHLAYIVNHALPMSGQSSIPLLLSLIMAIFYLSGTFHHQRTAWGLFVLPVVLLLILIHVVKPANLGGMDMPPERSTKMWTWLHLTFLLLGDVGLCVAFLASVMYLVQARYLKHKVRPDHAPRLLSLERLERMSRRAITLAFPLLTSGLLIGLLLMIQTGEMRWWDAKLITAGLLWLALVVLITIRFGLHMSGRRVAWLTILAFLLMVAAFAVSWLLPTQHPTGVLGR